jgi:hypothetical protein
MKTTTVLTAFLVLLLIVSEIAALRIVYSEEFVYPPRMFVFVEPASIYASVRQIFNVSVKINASEYWDVANFYINLHYDSALLEFQNATEGNFLKQHGEPTWGYVDTSILGTVKVTFAKLENRTPSSGVDTLFDLRFKVKYLSYSQPTNSCVLGIAYADMVPWAHPERLEPPWLGKVTAFQYPMDQRPSPPADPWSFYSVNGMFYLNFGDLNCDGHINLSDLTLFAKAYGSDPTSLNWMETADLAEPFGRIGISDLVTLAYYYSQR